MEEQDMPPAVAPSGQKPAVPEARKGLSRKQRTVIIAVAAIAVVALVAGIGVGVANHNRTVAAQQARAAEVAKARTACDKSIDRLIRAQDALAAKKQDKTVAAALKVKASDVKDGKTVTALADSLKDSSAVAGCKANTVKALDTAAKQNDKAAKALSAQAGKVDSAAKAVTDSQAAKAADDKAKADAEAAKKAQEAQAAAAAAAQAAQQSQTQPQSAGSSSYPGSSYSGRRSYTPTYTAPRTYTPTNRSTPSQGGASSSQNNSGGAGGVVIPPSTVNPNCDGQHYCPIG